jgi:hypothetical protein
LLKFLMIAIAMISFGVSNTNAAEDDICSQPGYHCSPKLDEPTPSPTDKATPTSSSPCSSPDTLDVLSKIVDDNAMNAIRQSAKPNGNIDDKFIDIVTTDKTESKTSCKFDIELHITGKNAQGYPIDVTKTWSETTGKQLRYTVEHTDDGQLLVTAYGLK